MSRTVIDIDDDLLHEAARLLETSTKRATVHAALREAVAVRLRREDLAAAAGGAYEDALNPDIMAAAWR
ncbi:MAG: type II toxin-antitoxin system VapB family antitoxin [Geodermatophilaceae bacterium]|jgi:Arc/MetJ family transcription regulator|nr:type II toxin-antitoxin system VapB family antitoxin [Geodermatophilaceae bacterium]MDQ3463936.1 type II toxin-antitoxin system VapB family antitoxin [Actinomycetota bacterium]